MPFEAFRDRQWRLDNARAVTSGIGGLDLSSTA
jgi:hypothetical protein